MTSLGVRPEADPPAPDVRQRISDAGRELFLAQGYEQTTVDAIAERAGIARRTFFRYFRSKDDVIFPDHDRIAQLTAAHLDALDGVPPLRAVCSGARQILRSYVDDPLVSAERYRRVRSVPALRAREIASVAQYTRLFSKYLRRRLGDAPGAGLTADVAAAAVVAAHNHVLREWLRTGGSDDPYPALEKAFDWVVARFDAAPGGAGGSGVAGGSGEPGSASSSGTLPGDGQNVVVAVFRAGDRIDDVVERISRSL